MKTKIIEVNKNRKIIILDDFFTFSEISGNYNNAISYKYSIYNSSESEVQNLSNKRLGCPLEITDPILMNIFDEKRLEIIKNYIPQENFYHWRSYINFGIHSDNHKIHVDDFTVGDGITLLYYINRNWDKDWGGETIFYDDGGNEILYISPFVVGRLIIFSSTIPHSAKPQHFNAPPYRFTLASKFKRHGSV